MDHLPSLRSFYGFCFNVNWTCCSFTAARELHPTLAWLYLVILVCCLLFCSKMLTHPLSPSCRYSVSIFNLFHFVTVLTARVSYAQSPGKDTTSIRPTGAAIGVVPLPTHASSEVFEISGITTTFRPIFTVPTEPTLVLPCSPTSMISMLQTHKPCVPDTLQQT